MASIESRMTGLESRMTTGFDLVDSRFALLESSMTAGFVSLHSRVSALESTVALDANLVAFRRETLSNFDGVYKNFDRLETEYQALTAAVKRIEEQHDSEN